MEVREARAKYLAKPGVKQTEIGTTPADWKAKQLRDFQSFVTSGSRGWAAYYSEIGAPFIRITNLSRECIYPDLSDTRYVSVPPNDVEGIRTRLRTGDVLISITADIGIVGYVTDEIPTPAYINQHIALVRFNPLEVCPKYISYFLASGDSQKAFQALTDSGAKSGMNLTTVSNIWAALPPTVEEQQAIAAALGDADALIESLEHLLAKKRQIKQGTMQALLTGQQRLPGFEGVWSPRQLSQLAEIRGGGTPATSRQEFWGGRLLWCTPTDITSLNGHKYLADTERTITDAGLKSSSAEIVPANSIVMTSRATIGECAINLTPVCTNQGFKNFVPFEHTDTEFLFYLLTTQKQGFVSLCGGSTFLEIGKSQLSGYQVPVPDDKSEQTAIATVLADMDAEIAALEARLAKARALKQGMMQALLTGRIRLV